MNPAFGGVRNSIISLMIPRPCKRPNHGTLLQLLWKPCSSRTVFRACNPDGGGVTDRSMHFTVCVCPQGASGWMRRGCRQASILYRLSMNALAPERELLSVRGRFRCDWPQTWNNSIFGAKAFIVTRYKTNFISSAGAFNYNFWKRGDRMRLGGKFD